MDTNPTFQFRIDPVTRDAAATNLMKMGLTLSDFLHMVVTDAARDMINPMDFMVPSETTLAAMHELEEGRGHRCNSVEELMADLNSDD